jgi:hypothetical protein
VLLLCQERLALQCRVDGPDELSFEAAERLATTLALGLLALEVGAGRRVDASLRDRDPVQGAVQLAVAAAIEPVALVLARAGVERCDAGVAGKLGIGAEAGDRSDFAEQLGGGQAAAAGQFEQPRRGRRGLRFEFAVELCD